MIPKNHFKNRMIEAVKKQALEPINREAAGPTPEQAAAKVLEESNQRRLQRFQQGLAALRQETGCDLRPIVHIVGNQIASDVQIFVVN